MRIPKNHGAGGGEGKEIMIKRRLSYPLHSGPGNMRAASASSGRREMRKVSRTLRSASIDRRSTEAKPSTSRETHTNRRKAASFSAFDASRCVACKCEVRSPKMMKCRHVFCLECFSNRLMISYKQEGSTCPICNIAVINDTASKKSAVSFAPLPPKMRDEVCRVCGETSVNKCRHCKRRFCDDCWTSHVNGLKDEIANINGDLEMSSAKFEDEIKKFRDRANETKEFVNRDIEAKIAALEKKRQDRIEKVEGIIVASEAPVDDIKQRMRRAQAELKEQQEVAYDLLPDNEEKVKTFLDLQQKAAEVMAAIAIWASELNDVETGLERISAPARPPPDKKKSVGHLHKRNVAPEIIVNRNTVQRPSALAVDSWRDNIIAACPGAGQVVILDRRFKVARRIRHQEMMAPQGIAFVQEQDEIYVTDKWKHCIFVFDHKGELVRRMCGKGYGESELRSPEGITFHPERNALYVADTGNNRVQILEKDGTYLDCIGPRNKHATGTARLRKSHLNQPTDVVVTATRVVVADSGNHKVKIFDQDGQLLQAIGGVGTAKGLFRSPEVLEIDKKENIIVGDAGNGRVQIFSQEGKFLRMLGGNRTQGHKFGWVSGLLVLNNHGILVSDSKTNSIYLF